MRGDREGVGGLDHRVVPLPHPVAPLFRELPQGATVHRPHFVLEQLILPLLLIHRVDPPLAVALGEKPMNARPDGIDDGTVDTHQVAEGREASRHRHVAQHHLIARVLARRPELREPFGPPEGKRDVPDPGIAREDLSGDAQLEHVGQLVADGVTEIRIAAVERERDALLQKLGDAEQAFRRHERQHVGLLEIRVRSIDDERDAVANVVLEAQLQREVALLGVAQRHAGELLRLRIVVEVDVGAAQHAPVEGMVLNLVLAERSELRRGGDRRKEGEADDARPGPVHRCTLRMRSPCAMAASAVAPPTTCPNTVYVPSSRGSAA